MIVPKTIALPFGYFLKEININLDLSYLIQKEGILFSLPINHFLLQNEANKASFGCKPDDFKSFTVYIYYSLRIEHLNIVR